MTGLISVRPFYGSEISAVSQKACIVTERRLERQQARSICGHGSLITSITLTSMCSFWLRLYHTDTESKSLLRKVVFSERHKSDVKCGIVIFLESFKC